MSVMESHQQDASGITSQEVSGVSIYCGMDEARGQPIYFPFASGQYRMSLGLQTLSLDDWLKIDDRFLHYLHQKQEQLAHHRAASVLAIPGTEDAQQELLDTLLEYLPSHFPTYFERQGATIVNLKTNQIWNPQDFAKTPIDLAGRLVQEDLCLMTPNQDEYILGAASVCFPLHWQPQDKIGQSVTHIHDPVPGYQQKLQRPVETYFDRLRPEAPGCRFNWTVIGSPDLVLDSETVRQFGEAITSSSIPASIWIRVERQTLRKLPQTAAIVFSIRTYIYPLSLLEKYPQAASGLSQAVQQIPAPMKRYKNLAVLSETVRTYLDHIIYREQL